MIPKINEYRERVFEIIGKICSEEMENILAASRIMADCIERGNLIYAFGAGHSMALALDIFYRAGGLPQVYPMLDISVSAYNGAIKSTELEKLPGYARVLVDYYGVGEGSTIIVISNSGNRVLPVEVGVEAKRRGAKTIAVTSKKYSESLPAENPYGKRLYEVADITVDNKVPPGDAIIELDGLPTKIAPVSTIINSFILQSLVIATIDELIKKGTKPKIWVSAHIPGGEERNRAVIAEFFGKIKPL
ncbi:MAG: SIS domain-containing protein [Candidatus Bathyarchaeia archaeon]|nr:SIS domain-containing protein [Candidatus Bathyarchaeota archaeon]